MDISCIDIYSTVRLLKKPTQDNPANQNAGLGTRAHCTPRAHQFALGELG